MKMTGRIVSFYCLLTKNENKKEKEFEANVVSGIRLIVNGKKRYQLLNVGRGNLKVKQIYIYVSIWGWRGRTPCVECICLWAS